MKTNVDRFILQHTKGRYGKVEARSNQGEYFYQPVRWANLRKKALQK